MSRRDWIIAALLAFTWGYWLWQHERWHELVVRNAELKGRVETLAEVCRSIKDLRK